MKREKLPHDGRIIHDYSAHRKFIRHWVDDAAAAFKKTRLLCRDHGARGPMATRNV